MKGIGTFVIVGTVLVGLGLLGTTLRADPYPGLYQDAMVRLMEHRLDWTGGLTSLEPRPMNTPAPPVGPNGPTLQQLPSARAGIEAAQVSGSRAVIQAIPGEVGIQSAQALKRADALRQAGVRFQIPERRPPTGPTVSLSPTSEERCVSVIRNPQLDVVEFGDGTGSIEHWSILYQKVYYSNVDYVSEHHSLVMDDEPIGEDTDIDDFWGTGLDYDMFGQGFWTPPDMTRIIVWFSSAYTSWNQNDVAWANLVSLSDEGYVHPDNFEAVDEIPMKEAATWEDWEWEITAADYPQWMRDMSDRPMAIVFDHLSDRQAPHQTIWLDDVYVILCYQWEAPSSAIYLPALQRQIPADPGPRCIPREPDSLDNPGFTTVDATCHSSFSALDQRDYYTLDLRGASNIRLRLFDLPSGTNWDAMIYENAAGYPIACHIGTPGHEDKWKDCGLDPAKSYFVLVNRGPGTSSGAYNLRVDRR